MFERCLQDVLMYEGVYSNHPLDRGGETFRGIARNFHPNWDGWSIVDRVKAEYGVTGLHKRNEKLMGLVAEFYKTKFWNRVKADEIDKINKPLACNVFDFAVNAGNKRAAKVLQKAINFLYRAEKDSRRVVEDGIIGPVTLKHVDNFKEQPLLFAFKVQRAKYYIKLVKKNPKYLVFLDGWVTRAISA